MHGADVHHHRQLRTGNLRQVGNLPEMVHTHLHHRHLGILRHGKDGHGHTDVVVVVGGGLGYPVGAFQHRRHHLLGGAFSHGAGDAHHLHAQAQPLLLCDFAQSQPHIRHHNGRIVPIAVGAQHRRRTFFQGCGDKVVSVPDTLQGQEQLPRLNLPAVIVGTQKGDLFIFFLHAAAAPKGCLLQRNSAHNQFLFSSR